MIDMPAAHNEVVTEAHVRKCRERGHGGWTINGIEQMFCPRCGDVKIETVES